LLEVLVQLGAVRTMVVSGTDVNAGAICEISVTGPTHIAQFDAEEAGGGGSAPASRDGTRYMLNPEELGLQRHMSSEELVIRSPEDSANKIKALFEGHKGPVRDIILANAAAALWVGGAVDSLVAGVAKAGTAIDSGGAMKTLEKLVRFSHE
ncbi:MAG: hypothetical protein FWD53_13320, partial [Phycisphaerales bacterium]|nr:hypothetical protein [Phycisphaerales bacterium]